MKGIKKTECPKCKTKLFILPHYSVCTKCGYKIKTKDCKPESKKTECKYPRCFKHEAVFDLNCENCKLDIADERKQNLKPDPKCKCHCHTDCPCFDDVTSCPHCKPEPKCKRCGKQYVIKGVQVCSCEGVLEWGEPLQSPKLNKKKFIKLAHKIHGYSDDCPLCKSPSDWEYFNNWFKEWEDRDEKWFIRMPKKVVKDFIISQQLIWKEELRKKIEKMRNNPDKLCYDCNDGKLEEVLDLLK